MSNPIKNIMILIVTVSIMLLIAEGIVVLKNRDMKNYDVEMWRYAKYIKMRSDDPMMGHEHRPNQKGVFQSVEIRTNNFGLRGPDIVMNSSKKRRILFLGSSCTLGWGVPESETITAILQEKLGDDTEVLNAGIGNYNTVRYVELFLKKLYILNPTDVVVQYFINDTEVLEAAGGNWFLRNSQFAVMLWHVLNNVLQQNTEKDIVEYYRGLYQPNAAGFKEMKKALDRLKEYTDPRGIRVYFLMTPDFYNISDYKYNFIHEIMRKEAVERGFLYLDLLPAFTNVKNSRSLWVMEKDPHPNGAVQRIMADYFFKHSDLHNTKPPYTNKSE